MVEGSIDLNKFYELARQDVAKLLGAAGIRSAAIYNASGKDVTFHVFDYGDKLYILNAHTTLVANGYYGTVAASGKQFKIHPDNRRKHHFLVAPGSAVIYRGPGKIEVAA